MTGPAPQVLEAVMKVVSERSGLRFTKATQNRLVSSVEARAKARGVPVDRYPEVLADEPSERQEFVELLTVPETFFFRDNAQFRALADEVVPRIKGTVVAWSAGCSTGPEPYSLAMTFAELGVPDWWVVASDMSRHAVERTTNGWYRERELRGLPVSRRNRWFEPVKGGWQAKPELRGRIRTVRHNIATDPPPVRQHEVSVVFCRNVLIYLHPDAIAAFLGKVADWLAPGGYLFLGMSEVLWEVDSRFDRVRLDGGAFAYRRIDEKTRRTLQPARRDTSGAAEESLAELRTTLPPPRRTAPASRPSAPPPRRDASRAVPTADGTAIGLRHQGEAALASGKTEEAIAALRKAIYLDPDDALAHLQLGLALEASGDADAGRRAFRAARSAVERTDRAALEAGLEGYDIDTIRSLLQAKLGVER